MDICEAIEEGNSEIVDSSDFSATDFPSEIPLPRAKAIDDARHEEVKDWVIAVSMDEKIDQVRQVGCFVLPFFLPNFFNNSVVTLQYISIFTKHLRRFHLPNER